MSTKIIAILFQIQRNVNRTLGTRKVAKRSEIRHRARRIAELLGQLRNACQEDMDTVVRGRRSVLASRPQELAIEDQNDMVQQLLDSAQMNRGDM